MATASEQGTHLPRRATTGDAAALSELAAASFPMACPPELPVKAIAEHIATALSPAAFVAAMTDERVEIWVAPAPEPGVVDGYLMLVQPDPNHDPKPDLKPDPNPKPQHDPKPDPKPNIDAGHGGTESSAPPKTTGMLLLERIYVHPECLGTGTAQHLMNIAITRAQPYPGMWLGTNQANLRAQRFYLRNGFTIAGERTFFVGGVPNHDFVMIRPTSR